MMQTNLVTVGDIGASFIPRYSHGYNCPCDACGNCEPVYAPAAPDVPFPQTLRYGFHDGPGGVPHVVFNCSCDDCERGVPVATWAWFMAAGCVLWAVTLAVAGWLVGLVVGN